MLLGQVSEGKIKETVYRSVVARGEVEEAVAHSERWVDEAQIFRVGNENTLYEYNAKL